MTRRDHPEGGDNAAVGAATDVEGGCGADEDSKIRAVSDKNGGERTAQVNCLLLAPVEQNVAEQLQLLDDEWFATLIVVNQQGDVRRGLRSGVQFIGRAMSDDSPIAVGWSEIETFARRSGWVCVGFDAQEGVVVICSCVNIELDHPEGENTTKVDFVSIDVIGM
jgi:hypothetical protein